MTPTPSRNQTTFIMLTAFLNFVGIGIINPLAPFLVNGYVARRDIALTVALMFTAYSFFQFIASPTLGALSDRYGRRPVLFISLLGSAIGYVLMGVGGALSILFLGRILDGVTGGNVTVMNAYLADITKPEERTRAYGLLGAAGGMGFVIGPTLGGVLYRLTDSYTAPLFFAAGMTLVNVVWGYFVMPETLGVEKRNTKVTLTRLNPLTQLAQVFNLAQLRLLLVGIFFWAVAFAVVQSNFSSLAEDSLGWTPDQIGLGFLEYGLISVFAQVVLIRRWLPKFGETRLAIGGLLLMALGFLMVGALAVVNSLVIMIIGIALTALGTGLITPSLNGLLSNRVEAHQQGLAQGGNYSIQALARVVGPVWAGLSYQRIGPSAPYIFGAVGLVVAAVIILNLTTTLQPRHPMGELDVSAD